jgi:hypothetical protein
MKIEDIEIHTGSVDFEYEPIRRLEAKSEAATAFSRAPTMEDVNARMRQLAAGLGANAIIDVVYQSGVSLTSWKSMKASGLAVRRVSDDMKCPVCAELIKRAAIRCRFCGTPIASNWDRVPDLSVASDRDATVDRAGNTVSVVAEPLRSTDNPWWVVALIAGVVFILFMIANLP